MVPYIYNPHFFPGTQASVNTSYSHLGEISGSFRLDQRPMHQSDMSTPVDDLATELLAITLTDNEVNSDSHHKLWDSHLEVQRDKGKAYLDAELAAKDT